MRCDSDHHGLSVAPRPEGSVLHHQAWEVQDFAARCQYYDELALERPELDWDRVRDGPGFNLATYLFDLGGGLLEVYSALLSIHDEGTCALVDWSRRPNSLNL